MYGSHPPVPLWWLGVPAILKGWVGRVFAVGRAYGGGRCFDRGVFAGKHAMCSITVGGASDAYSEHGIYPVLEVVLYPIRRGIPEFVGFTAIEPFIVFAPQRLSEADRATLLALHRERVLRLSS